MVVAGGTWVQRMVGKRARVRGHFRVTQNSQQRLLNFPPTHPPLKWDVQGTSVYK